MNSNNDKNRSFDDEPTSKTIGSCRNSDLTAVNVVVDDKGVDVAVLKENDTTTTAATSSTKVDDGSSIDRTADSNNIKDVIIAVDKDSLCNTKNKYIKTHHPTMTDSTSNHDAIVHDDDNNNNNHNNSMDAKIHEDCNIYTKNAHATSTVTAIYQNNEDAFLRTINFMLMMPPPPSIESHHQIPTSNKTIGQVLQKYLSNHEQLQLYGLYKQSSTPTNNAMSTNTSTTNATIAKTSAESSSSWWNTISNSTLNVREYKKRCAWESYQHLSINDARMTYIEYLTKVVSSLVLRNPTSIALEYDQHALLSLHTFLLDITKEFQRCHPNVDQHLQINEELHGAGRSDDMTQTQSLPITKTNVSHPALPSAPNSNTTINFHCRPKELTTIIRKNVWFQPLQSRGTLDISYHDLHFTIRKIIELYTTTTSWFLPWYPNHYRREQQLLLQYESYEHNIQSLWKHAIASYRKQHQLCDIYRPEPSDISITSTASGLPNDTATTSNAHATASKSTTTDECCDIVIGLSVRSLLDLILQHVQQHSNVTNNHFQKKEIIISPPINVPGIIQVLQYHNIEIVGVDVKEQHQQSNLSRFNNIDRQGEGGSGDSVVELSIDVNAIEKNITSSTIAIMIVHVFGMLVASREDMEQLRTIISTSKLMNILLLEDCAECFTSLSAITTEPTKTESEKAMVSYLGSPFADVSFFSFGFIKTMTTINGGIAVIWNQSSVVNNNKVDYNKNKALFESITRLQQSYVYPYQSNIHYLQQVCKCYILLYISRSPILYGAIYTIISKMLGLPFDAIVASLLRGFPIKDRKQMIQRIRQKPSIGMMVLLNRRLSSQSNCISSSVSHRIHNCKFLLDLVRQEQQQNGMMMTNIRTITSKMDCPNYYWLNPIFVKDPIALSKHLRCCGYDATSGTSQLCCVPTTKSTSFPIATQMMSEILYLPINPDSTNESSARLLTALRTFYKNIDCLEDTNESTATMLPSEGISRDRKPLRPIHAISGMFVLCLWYYFIHVTILLLQCIFFVLLIYGAFIWLLRLHMGQFYLNSSNAFAKYNFLLYNTDMNQSQNTPSVESQLDGCDILSAMESLHLPKSESSGMRTILLTGATGFVGSLLLRDLLFHRKELSIDCIIVVCRSKNGKSAATRIESLLNDEMFSFLTGYEKTTLVTLMEGDTSCPFAGLSDENVELLTRKYNVTHIFNCAASVSFTQSLPEAAAANILSSLNVQSLGSTIGEGRLQFIQISTAFVHGGSSENGQPLPEELYSLGLFDPVKIYESMCGSQFYASKAMSELSFPNTYTFSKSVAEHLLLLNDPNAIIIRPSIVGPAIQFPFEGWAGRTPSTLVAAACLYLSYQWNIWCFGLHRVPIIPVDVVARFVICKAFSISQSESAESYSLEDTSSDGSFEKISASRLKRLTSSSSSSSTDSEKRHHIFHAAWDVQSPTSTCFTWFDYAGAVTQVGSVLGYFSRPTAYLGLLVATRWLPHRKLSMQQFATMHEWFVKCPFHYAVQMVKVFGIDSYRMNRLHSYLDLPNLFYPFMNNPYHFQSELIAPSEFDGERYLMSCVAAAHKFIQKSEKSNKREDFHKANELRHFSLLTINGTHRRPYSRNIFWFMSQPSGNFFVRISGWILLHVLMRCWSDIIVDIQSFASALRVYKWKDPPCLILVPTHRSIFDSIIISMICLAIPELQIGMPSIAAADTFERLPLIGWLLSYLGAFFVRRGRKIVDPNLVETISTMNNKSTNSQSVVELFVEGTRSRDRRFVEPKTGVLRCLHDPSRQQIIVPITINYEHIPEQRSLVNEASGGLSSGMHLSALVTWLIDVFKGQMALGRVHIAACEPKLLGDEIDPDWKKIVREIQYRQAKYIRVSDYHVNATSILLKIDRGTIRRAFAAIGVQFFPHTYNSPIPDLPSDPSETMSIFLQVSPYIAPLCLTSRVLWSKWLWDSVECIGSVQEEVANHRDVQKLTEAMVALFDQADSYVDEAKTALRTNGFVQPKSSHIVEIAMRSNYNFPALLLQASIENKLASKKNTTAGRSDTDRLIHVPRVKVGTNEALGYWGYYESQFVLQMDADGRTFVRMEGNHYNLQNKKISGLLSFMESETGINIDPLDEAFGTAPVNWKVAPCTIRDTELDQLKKAVSFVSKSNEDRIRHGTGHSQDDIMLLRCKEDLRVPDVVVRPKSEEEIQSLIELSQQQKWCVIPFGGGTNVTNALRCPSLDIEPRPIISIDMRDMCQILWIDDDNRVAHIQAGITGRRLEFLLASRGYTMGHEPDSIEFSTLGGWIATKASGMKRNKYGNIEDIVKAVRVIGPDGALCHGQNRSQSVWGRESCGLDLRNLVLGSEGCLGVITSAFVRIWPLPICKDYDCVLFPCFIDGLRFVREVSELGSNLPTSIRLLDNEHFRLGLALRPDSSSVVSSFFSWCYGIYLKSARGYDPKSMISVTFMYEGTVAEVKRQKQAVNRLRLQYGGERLGYSAGKAGYELTFMIAYIRDFALSYHFLSESFETFSPWSQVETIITQTKAKIYKEHEKRYLPGKPFVGCRVTQLYHEGACLYFYFCMNINGVDNASSVFSEIEHEARCVILANGGSLSHHHGIGKLRASYLKETDSDPLLKTIRKIKHGMDPDNIFGARNGGFN